jgi:GNAT superfamily N-acetyltransferase
MLAKPIRFDESYREDATLLDGSLVQLRLVRPSDKALLLEGFERLSPESRYRRFFTPKVRISEEELHYLTEVDGRKHFALGAVRLTPDGERGVGIARFIACEDDPEVAEAAIAVVDEEQGKGLGRILLERLSDAARERGVIQFRCDVLAENDRMRSLLHEVSPGRIEKLEGEVVTVELALPVEQPEPGGFRDSALYKFLAHAARGALRIRGRS